MTQQFLTPGQPAPIFALKAIKSERLIGPQNNPGEVLGLIFHGRETVQAVEDIQTLVRPEFPQASQLTLASVVDLSSVPRLMRRVIKPLLAQAIEDAYRRIPPEYDPADYVFLLPDWDGKVSKAYGVRNTDRVAAVVVIDSAGRITGSYQGPEPGPATLALVRQAAGHSVA